MARARSQLTLFPILFFSLGCLLFAQDSQSETEFWRILNSENYRENVAQFIGKQSIPDQKILIGVLDTQGVTLDRKKLIFELLSQSGAQSAALPTFLSAIAKRRNYQNPQELSWMAEEASKMVRGNPEVIAKYEEALGGKLRRLMNEPTVIGNLRAKSPFEEKLAIAQVLSRVGSEEAINFLIEELKKPLDPEVPEANRLNYTRLAEAFASALKENPAVMTNHLRAEILSLLASKEPKLTAAQNDLNKFLPKEIISPLDKEITTQRLHPSNTDSCLVMCRIAHALSEKINESFAIPADKYLWTNDAKSSFGFAVRGLMGEFLLKANQAGCEIPGIDNKVNKLMAEAKEFAINNEGKKGRRETEETRRALLESGLAEVDVMRALEFVNKNEPLTNIDSKGLPTNSATLYFYLQTQRAVETLKQAGAKTDSKSLDEIQKRIEDHLIKITDARSELLHSDEGSVVTTYALAAMGASMPNGSESQKRLAQIFSEMRDEFKRKGEGGFPYNFDPGVLRQTERGAAARSVVAQLAIYKGGNTQDKLTNADELLTSLVTYDKHFRDIFSGIGLNRTHDREDVDLLAPYYGPSTIPYAFEAISLLKREKGLTSDQIQKVKSLESDLEKKLLGMFEPDGLFQPQNSNYYSAAPLYDNALTGLALQQACQEKRSAKPIGATDEHRPTTGTIRTH